MYVKFYMFANMYVHLILVSMSKYAIYALIYEFMHYFTSASQMTSHYNMICLLKIFSGTKSILFTTEKSPRNRCTKEYSVISDYIHTMHFFKELNRTTKNCKLQSRKNVLKSIIKYVT